MPFSDYIRTEVEEMRENGQLSEKGWKAIQELVFFQKMWNQ